jgi:hypothetical protein
MGQHPACRCATVHILLNAFTRLRTCHNGAIGYDSGALLGDCADRGADLSGGIKGSRTPFCPVSAGLLINLDFFQWSLAWRNASQYKLLRLIVMYVVASKHGTSEQLQAPCEH